jgi:hypothetical protein
MMYRATLFIATFYVGLMISIKQIPRDLVIPEIYVSFSDRWEKQAGRVCTWFKGRLSHPHDLSLL